VWEVNWGRTGYSGCKKVMDLKGHSSQVGKNLGSRPLTHIKRSFLLHYNKPSFCAADLHPADLQGKLSHVSKAS